MRDNNRLIRSTVFYLSLNPGGSAIYKLSPMQKLVQPHSASHCAAQFNFQAFQHTRLWQWTTTARPAPKTAAQTHRFMGKSTLPSPNTCTHVWHDHIWSLHFTHPPPPRTPRPSTQQHPVLTFKDACTEAVKDEHQVLLDNHILLFSFAILRQHSTRGLTLFILSLSLLSSRWTYPGERRSFWLTGVTLMNSCLFLRSPCVFFADQGAVITVVKQDGRDARRQSADPASLYCLSLWLAAESKSPAHAFWLMKTLHQWRTPRNSSDLRYTVETITP